MRLRTLALAIAICLVAPLASAQSVGIVTRVQSKSFQKTGDVGHALRDSSSVYRDALIYTKRFGSVQIRLEDDSDLLISPNSSIVIDDFVYDGGDQGAFGMSLVSGALRVVSGRLSKPSYRVSTIVAQVGVRGTRYWLDVDEPGILKIWVDEGAVEARPAQSDEVFVFEAPVYAECTVTTCALSDAPPKPVKFPDDPTRR